MKERPILFTPENVRKILAEEKTQTRRVVNPQPQPPGVLTQGDGNWRVLRPDGMTEVFDWHDCPYGSVGDRLWVKEAWRVGKPQDHRTPTEIWEHLKNIGKGITILYGAGGWRSTAPVERTETKYPDNEPMPDWAGIKRSAMFMPRWASRITLEITDVRVERLQDISEEDAIAEGIHSDRVITGVHCYGGPPIEEHGDRFWPSKDDTREEGFEDAVSAYAALWDSINGEKHPWANNDWVWAITFKQI